VGWKEAASHSPTLALATLAQKSRVAWEQLGHMQTDWQLPRCTTTRVVEPYPDDRSSSLEAEDPALTSHT